MFDHKRTAIGRVRQFYQARFNIHEGRATGQLWQTRFNIHEGRATGQLLYNQALVRDFKNIKITEGRFKVDIGTGSGVKVSFKI